MLAWLIRYEDKQTAEKDDEEFKARIFAADPERFFKLFPQESEEELDIEERLPETEREFQQMLSELRDLGHIR